MPGENLVPSMAVMVMSLFLLAASSVGLNCVKDEPKKKFLTVSGILSVVGIILSLIIMYMSSHSDPVMQME
jgi:hypothetical protein